MFHRVLRFGLLCFPILLTAAFICRFGSNLPFMDQYGFIWRMMYLKQHDSSGLLFWTPHNEHRLFFPQLLMWGMSVLTDWSIRAEMAAGFLLSLSGFYMLCRGRFNRTPYLCIISGFFWFSLSQWENWLWGWQIQIFTMQACVVFCCYYLSQPFTWKHFCLAMLSAIIGSLSYGSGLVAWPIALPIFYLLYRHHKQEAVAAALFWLTTAMLLFYVYFHPTEYFSKSPHPTSLLDGIKYFLIFLGAPLSAQQLIPSLILGATGVLLFALLSLRIYCLEKPSQSLLFFWLLAAFALGNAALVSLSRAGFGVEQAFSSRYISIGNLFWVGLLGCYWDWRGQFAKQVLAPLLLLGMIATSIQGYHQGAAHAVKLAELELYLKQNENWDSAKLDYLHRRPYFASTMLIWLKKNQMALFHK